MVKVLDNLLQDGQILLRAVVGLMAIWFVAWTWVRTRSLVPVLGAVLVGAVVVWGVSVSGMDTIKREVNEDVDTYSDGGRRLGGG